MHQLSQFTVDLADQNTPNENNTIQRYKYCESVMFNFQGTCITCPFLILMVSLCMTTHYLKAVYIVVNE